MFGIQNFTNHKPDCTAGSGIDPSRSSIFFEVIRWARKKNKQILFNTFDDSLPMQMPISTQRKLRLLALLQKKYLYTCKNIVTKPNLEEFLRKLFEQYRIENCGKQY